MTFRILPLMSLSRSFIHSEDLYQIKGFGIVYKSTVYRLEYSPVLVGRLLLWWPPSWSPQISCFEADPPVLRREKKEDEKKAQIHVFLAKSLILWDKIPKKMVAPIGFKTLWFNSAINDNNRQICYQQTTFEHLYSTFQHSNSFGYCLKIDKTLHLGWILHVKHLKMSPKISPKPPVLAWKVSWFGTLSPHKSPYLTKFQVLKSADLSGNIWYTAAVCCKLLCGDLELMGHLIVKCPT